MTKFTSRGWVRKCVLEFEINSHTEKLIRIKTAFDWECVPGNSAKILLKHMTQNRWNYHMNTVIKLSGRHKQNDNKMTRLRDPDHQISRGWSGSRNPVILSAGAAARTNLGRSDGPDHVIQSFCYYLPMETPSSEHHESLLMISQHCFR